MCHCKYTCTHYIYIFSILGILEYIVHTQCVYRIPILTADVFVEYSDFRKLGIPLGGSGILPEQMGRRLGFNVLGGIGEMATCSAPVWQENPDHQTWWDFQGFVSWPKALISWFLKKFWNLPPKIDHHVPHWNWMSYQCLETFTWRSTRNEPHKPLLHISDCFIACLAMLGGKNLSQVEMVRNLQLTGYLHIFTICQVLQVLFPPRELFTVPYSSPLTRMDLCVFCPRICCCYLQRREAQAWISLAPIAWFFSILNLGETCGKWLRDELRWWMLVVTPMVTGNRKNLGISGCCRLKETGFERVGKNEGDSICHEDWNPANDAQVG